MAIAPLIQPPRLRTSEDRTASRLELFFDLAYVLVVAQLADAFVEDLTLHGAAVFAGLFTVTWWSWVTTTLYANRFDTNDVPYRLAKLAQTFAVAVMAASAADAPGADGPFFAAGFIATRVVLVLLYLRAYRHVPEARTTMLLYLSGAAASVMLWSVSLGVTGTPRFALWAVGIGIEALAPLAATRWGADVPLHEEHLPERFGLFTILVLGESITSVVTGLHDTAWALASTATAGLGFVIAAAVWWTYFDLGGAAGKHDLLEHEPEVSDRHDRYVYGHLPLLIGVAAAGIGIEEFVLHPAGDLEPAARWALCGGLALFLAGVALVMAGTADDWRAAWPWPAAAVPLLAGAGMLAFLPPVLLAGAVTVILAATVLSGIQRQRHGRLETTET